MRKCKQKLLEQTQKQNDRLNNNEGKEKYLIRDTIIQKEIDTLFQTVYDTIIRSFVRMDTMICIKSEQYIHPFFIKTIKVKKSVWYGMVNGVGGTALAGSIALGIQAQDNYRKHNAYIASTRQDHLQYYQQYRVCNGLMWGCLGVAVAAFVSNFLAVQVCDVKIIPGVMMDLQGQPQVSLNVRF